MRCVLKSALQNCSAGLSPERRLASKRADYFAAGTRVVWDVDVLREEVVRVYRASDPATPTVYHKGDRAEAEPAVPGWLVDAGRRSVPAGPTGHRNAQLAVGIVLR